MGDTRWKKRKMGQLLMNVLKTNYTDLVDETNTSDEDLLRSVAVSGIVLMQCLLVLEKKKKLFNINVKWEDILSNFWEMVKDRTVKREHLKIFYKQEEALISNIEKNAQLRHRMGIEVPVSVIEGLNFVVDPTGEYIRHLLDKQFLAKTKAKVVPRPVKIRSSARFLAASAIHCELYWGMELNECDIQFQYPYTGRERPRPAAGAEEPPSDPVQPVITQSIGVKGVEFRILASVSHEQACTAVYFTAYEDKIEALVVQPKMGKARLEDFGYEDLYRLNESCKKKQRDQMTIRLPQPSCAEPVSLRRINQRPPKKENQVCGLKFINHLKYFFRTKNKQKFTRCFSPNKADFCPFETKKKFGMENAFPLYDCFMNSNFQPKIHYPSAPTEKFTFPESKDKVCIVAETAPRQENEGGRTAGRSRSRSRSRSRRREGESGTDRQGSGMDNPQSAASVSSLPVSAGPAGAVVEAHTVDSPYIMFINYDTGLGRVPVEISYNNVF
ncbi:unnamed protein product [Bursaphelenchus okinawaensis]|uniref:Uncharacterized protein n=1 Tax=Bursaphelenchus okinawaensis TaxID=465554 RepID=A0A811KSZ2_9BILA|nr:unnamed protein product [Bursaphelenchus okinawaensis]CAG9109379.1 unnamed protein product [Bursaphelenchus okinawaensis]